MNQAELKRARALQQKKFRSEERRFLVQGRKVVEELLRSSWQTEVIFASAEATEFVEPLARAARGGAVPVRTLPDHELEKIGTLEKGNELDRAGGDARIRRRRARRGRTRSSSRSTASPIRETWAA